MNTATAPVTRTPAAPPAGSSVATTNASAAPSKPPGVGEQLMARSSQFQAALPAHIPYERFMRVVLTAIQRNADLAGADRTSLFTSALQAAQDGLLPDGREGALVIYNSKVREGGREIWVKMVQWMPMIAGIRKKVRNSGEIATWEVQVVHANDAFEFELGDDPFIKHRPCMNGDPGPVVAAYSVATLKSGEKSREVMTKAQIDKIKAASKSASSGPWVQWYEEMCRKAVARRHAKVLPMSTDLDDVIRRDDDLYDMKGAREAAAAANGGRPQSLAGKLEILANAPGRENAPIVERSGPTRDEEDGGTTLHQPDQGNEAGGGDAGSADDAGADTGQPTPAADDPKKAALLERLDKAAAKGTAALRRALGGLSEADQALLTDKDHDALGDAAEKADKAKEGADASPSR